MMKSKFHKGYGATVKKIRHFAVAKTNYFSVVQKYCTY